MRILSFLNVSNISNLEADSGYVFQRSLLHDLAQKGYEVSLIGPPKMPCLPEVIQPIFLPFSDSKFGVRMSIEWEKLKLLLTHTKPFDIALINQSELTLALKLLFYEVWNKSIPCITYYHYLAIQGISEEGNIKFDPSQNLFGAGQAIWKRQLESALVSDANIIGSQFGKRLFLTAAGSQTKDIFMEVIPPPVQDYKQSCILSISNSTKNIRKPTLIYNHRLYTHYGGCEIFDYLKELNDKIPFILVVTDPTDKRSTFRNQLDPSPTDIRKYLATLPFVKIRHFSTQETYYQALTQVDIGISHLRSGALWSMAIVDLMSRGKPVVCFNSGAMPEIVEDNDLLFSNKEDFQHIIIKLLMDSSFYREKSKSVAKRANNFLPKSISDKFHNIFLDVMN
ncbi:glycosyl transferase, group 1 family protein [Coleofasciculus chthonoplastes PCC 7420]|uniref:Glycosyl transferase, group 1 family protein n=1 Tax=Coleofasciculus chthonoplastes PCC 7420 TaxID=118168 RepID=B4VWD1_9CYAN|nr:glycosyltransferase [Coleofasciculus chthonoplastes]EDX73710.1 glycosyl transferase, group 1 family protein [Coleofasciculus chthonoplastes PCC 7420]